MLPYVYTPNLVKDLFADSPRKNFLSLAICIFSYRLY